MIAALVCRSFVALARRLPVRLIQQALLRQALPGSGDGWVRTAARLRLVLVYVVVARWSFDLFVEDGFVEDGGGYFPSMCTRQCLWI